MLIKSPDPKARHIDDYEFKSATGAVIVGASLCKDDGDSIEFTPDEIRISRVRAATPAVAAYTESYTIYMKDVAAIRHVEFDKVEPTLEQAMELARLVKDQYAHRTDLRPEL